MLFLVCVDFFGVWLLYIFYCVTLKGGVWENRSLSAEWCKRPQPREWRHHLEACSFVCIYGHFHFLQPIACALFTSLCTFLKVLYSCIASVLVVSCLFAVTFCLPTVVKIPIMIFSVFLLLHCSSSHCFGVYFVWSVFFCSHLLSCWASLLVVCGHS